ncbi:MAG: T9SS type A sorting domain-containing protein [Ignavibacteriae bacterium]|nr:T9SS type A sorting domain-containing protein [Ignavibacteriota bacterium]
MKKLLTLLLITALANLTLGAIEFNKTAEYKANTYSKFLVKSDNNIYQLTDIGLLKSTNEGETWLNLDSDLNLNEVTDFEVGSEGQLLIIYKDKVRVSENEGYTWLDITNELSSSVVTNLEVMASGMVLAATENGAFRWDGNANSWVKINLNSQSSNDVILAIGEDSEGNLLISGTSSGINISNDGGLTFSALDLGLSVGGSLSTITAIELDSKGNVWLGGSEGEIMTLNKATLELEEVLSSDVIADAIVDIESNSSLGILVSTKNKGIYSSADGTNFTKIQGSGNLVTNLEITNNNKLLVLDESAIANLNIYNSNGQIVASVSNLSLSPGVNRVGFHINDITNGTYFIELRLDKVTLTKQLVIVK